MIEDMYLPYLYQRPVLSSGRKLTKEYAGIATRQLLLRHEDRREKETRVQR